MSLETCLVPEVGVGSSLREGGTPVVSPTYPRYRMCHPEQLFPLTPAAALCWPFAGQRGKHCQWGPGKGKKRAVFFSSPSC